MGIFDFFRRKGNKPSRNWPDPKTMSRIDFLLQLKHRMLEAREEAYGGGNFLDLVEKQLETGESDLAFWNIGNQVNYCFELAILYWGQGDVARAETYFHKTIERHQRLVRACVALGLTRQSYIGIDCAKAAACLLGVEVDDFARSETFEPCYEPWFKDRLLSYCLETKDFDMDAWQASSDAWTKRRFPKYRLEEFSVYVKALTGQYRSTSEMLEAHEKMFVGRARRNPDAGLLEGYDDNELIIDYIFAAILKRIGWEGTYRHSWPHTAVVGSIPQTTREPDRYLGFLTSTQPQPDAETGIIEDVEVARRFIDRHVKVQRNDEGKRFAAERPGKERGKVAGAIKQLGWAADAATLDLMQAYCMDRICNDSTHISLCDPVGGGSFKLRDWTELLSGEFNLHPDFIAIAGSEEKADYRDPQGAWYVCWKRDGKIYMVDRDEWDRPELAIANAKLGFNMWPSYTSFVAWWVSEHVKSQTRKRAPGSI